MSTTLGLDLGTNSIGWALVEDGKKIIKTGVRIFPKGVNESNSGKEVSRNADRRSKRGARRAYHRYILRRKKLLAIFERIGITPPNNLIKISSYELFKLRKTALDEKISLQELARIWYLLNQRRGFKSNRKENSLSEDKNELTGIKAQISELENTIKKLNLRTVGEYFFHLFEVSRDLKDWHNPEEPYERIRGRYVSRAMYETEFDLIWQKQKEYYPEVLTEKLYNEVKNETIFYQRKLKSQRHLVSNCRFEPEKKVAPKSSLEFQEFRIWQNLANLRVTDEFRYLEPLTLEEKQLVANKLHLVENLKLTQIKKLLGLSSRDKLYFTDDEDETLVKGNSTASRIAKVTGEKFWVSLPEQPDDTFRNPENSHLLTKHNLWHLLFFSDNQEWLKNYSIVKLGFSEEIAEKFSNIALEQDYGSVSIKALIKGKAGDGILKFLKEGYDYAESAKRAGYNHSEETIIKEPDGLIKRMKGDAIDSLRNPVVQQTLGEAVRLVNAITLKYGKIDRVRIEMSRSLKKPKKEREKITLNNRVKSDLRNEYIEFLKNKGFTRITGSLLTKFELWLELDFYKDDFSKLSKKIPIEEFYKFARNVKKNDKEKFRLWLECGRISPYSGKPISLSKLFSPEIEIEHIVPYSRSLDDSFMNKTLCEREINQNKLNMTPREYFGEKSEEWRFFQERIKSFSVVKQEKFRIKDLPQDFDPQQLTNNAYIAREAVKLFRRICDDVQVTNGQATAHLRHLWGLPSIINTPGAHLKNRNDHRHHAVDALTIACTEIKHIRILSTLSQFNEGMIRVPDFPMPFVNFYKDAVENLSTLLVSHRNKKRLLVAKKNKIRLKNGKILRQSSVSVRGSLHDESNYGLTNLLGKNKEYILAHRKGLESITGLKQINEIIDDQIEKYLFELYETNPKGFSQQLREGIHMFGKDRKPLPYLKIKTLRSKKASNNIINLRPGDRKGLIVLPGNNYKIAIYENKKGKRISEVVTFFDAVKRAKQGEPIFREIKENYVYRFELTHNDMFLFTEETDIAKVRNDRELLFKNLYRLKKFNFNGRMAFQSHNIGGSDQENQVGVTLLDIWPSTLTGFKVSTNILGEVTIHD